MIENHEYPSGIKTIDSRPEAACDAFLRLSLVCFVKLAKCLLMRRWKEESESRGLTATVQFKDQVTSNRKSDIRFSGFTNKFGLKTTIT